MTKIIDLLAAGRRSPSSSSRPKTDAEQATLVRTLRELEPLDPSFMSVTYRGGATRAAHARPGRRHATQTTTLTADGPPHVRGPHPPELAELLVELREAGIENILALGGDPPADRRRRRAASCATPSSWSSWPAPSADFSIGVAAHPELHPRSPDRETDRRYLAEKLAAGRLRHHPVLLRRRRLPAHGRRARRPRRATSRCCPASCRSPTVGRSRRMAEMNGAEVPARMRRAPRGRRRRPRRRASASASSSATELCRDLLAAGAPGLHFYTLNRSDARPREIYEPTSASRLDA